MSWLVDALAWTLILAGSFFMVVGALGLARFPDLFTRLHAAGLTDTMGAALALLGFAVHHGAGLDPSHLFPDALVIARLLLIVAFLWFTSPIASHALARAALTAGHAPWKPRDGAAAEREEDAAS